MAYQDWTHNAISKEELESLWEVKKKLQVQPNSTKAKPPRKQTIDLSTLMAGSKLRAGR